MTQYTENSGRPYACVVARPDSLPRARQEPEPNAADQRPYLAEVENTRVRFPRNHPLTSTVRFG
jgi:hypothetical protein